MKEQFLVKFLLYRLPLIIPMTTVYFVRQARKIDTKVIGIKLDLFLFPKHQRCIAAIHSYFFFGRKEKCHFMSKTLNDLSKNFLTRI